MPDDNFEFLLEAVPEDEDISLIPSPAPRVGRDEMNLAEFPFALLSDRAPEGFTTVKFEDTVEGKDGKLVRRAWTVTGGEQFGLPVAGDEQVYVALMEISKESGFDQRTVPLTRYDLIKRLGWAHKGDSYRRLHDSLDRLLAVTIKAERAFWDKAAQRYVDVGFHIIDDYALYDEAPGRKRSRSQAEPAAQASLPLSFVTWNQVIFRSMRAGNIKQLDTTFYFSLRSSLSRRLYRYLDKKRYDGKGAFRIGMKKLAFEKLGMSRNYYPSHIRQELQRAHEELTEAGFLRGVHYVTARGATEPVVVYYFTTRDDPLASEPLPLPGDDELDPLPETLEDQRQALLDIGVTPAVARQLVDEFGDEVRLQLAYLSYRGAQDPPAVIVEAVRAKWEPPASYLKAQAEERRRLENQQKRQEEETEAEQARAEADLEQQTARALLDALPKGRREALEAEARQRVGERSPLVAGRPQSHAFRAMVAQELAQTLRLQDEARFEKMRRKLKPADA
jgi:hypothetical protein